MTVFVLWIDGGKLQRGILKKEDRNKLHLQSLTGRSLSLAAKRFHLRIDNGGAGVACFEALEGKAREVDLELLHETLGTAGAFTLREVAACWFSSERPSPEEEAILLIACADGAPWFKVDGSGKVLAAKAEEIERWRGEQASRIRQEEEQRELLDRLRRGLSGGIPISGPPDEVTSRLLAALEADLTGERPLREWPALETAVQRASREVRCPVPQAVRNVLASAGRLQNPYRLLMERFHRAFFGPSPEGGRDFAPCKNLHPDAPRAEIDQVRNDALNCLERLPAARHDGVFSVDDEGVQEIDDALSAERIDGDRFRAGVHIAAPGLFIPEGSVIHDRARAQALTVYQPDLKWTMLPLEVIEAFTLREGVAVPAVSYYFTFSRSTFELLEREVRLEALRPAANHTYAGLESALEGSFFPELELLDDDPDRVRAWLDRDPRDFPWRRAGALPGGTGESVELLLPLARSLFVRRCREGAGLFNRREFKITVKSAEEIQIRERPRNTLVEGIVTELMILTNGYTAARLAEGDLPAIYRTQRVVPAGDSGGEVVYRTSADLTVVPREHAGLGGTLYCWSTSPLRRYADLLNQRQLASLLGGGLPPFADTSELLVRAKHTELQNREADQHQRRMERYWTLKHLERQGSAAHPVTIYRRQGQPLARFDALPLTQRLEPSSGAAEGPARFVAESFDFYGLNVEGRIEGI